jgi:chromosome segregation ATPase
MKKLIERWLGFAHERETLQRLLSERTQRVSELVSELSAARKKISEYGVRIANQSEIIFDLKAELKNTKQKYTELTMRKNRKTNFAASAAGAQKSKKTKDASVFCANKQ